VRASLDDRSEKIGYRIREAQVEKLPYMLIVGDREVEDGTVAVRSRSKGDVGTSSLTDFTSSILEEIKEKRIG
jgi:threonyl-tRNA synthetase